MARKTNPRTEVSGSIRFDSRTNTVMAEATHDNIKEKVQAVREVVPGKSNNEVVLVLQYYDYNVERAIQAYLEDGAKAALQEWNFTGSKQPNKKRKNKKKGSGEKVGDKPDSATVPSLSLNLQEKTAVNGKTGLLPENSVHDNQTDEETPVSMPKLPPLTSMDVSDPVVSSSLPDSSTVPSSSSHMEASASTDPQLQQQSHTKSASHGDSHHQRQYSPRERTISEVSTGSAMGDGHHKKPHQGLEKAVKDLHRQTTSLERLRLLLDHEIDRSIKSIKSVFEELRQGLNNREEQLMAEMEVLKTEASDMLEMRQAKATELKRQVDRSDRLKDTEITELRAEIKHFVSERRHDEDLGRTTRFLYDSDHMLDEFRKFGEVVHVKSLYTARKASVSSVASTGLSPEGNHEEDWSHSQELTELQDRLKNSVRLQNSQNKGQSSSRHVSTQNGPSSDGNRPSGSPSSPSLTSATPRDYIQSSSGRGPPSSYSSSNTGRPSRGSGGPSPRGRGRGRGRGGGYGRGGQQYVSDRLPSSQAQSNLKTQSYSSESSSVRTST
ncbi:unnamed protein product [Candidula unifasciata]|uniref:CUE domain-containing protein n=1 Tax=Candidula unifasciata TaxID=100452 RepID=A0A8S3YEW1_9EUPU|nr:unnamed protein product [Candidula unifasciata]